MYKDLLFTAYILYDMIYCPNMVHIMYCTNTAWILPKYFPTFTQIFNLTFLQVILLKMIFRILLLSIGFKDFWIFFEIIFSTLSLSSYNLCSLKSRILGFSHGHQIFLNFSLYNWIKGFLESQLSLGHSVHWSESVSKYINGTPLC